MHGLTDKTTPTGAKHSMTLALSHILTTPLLMSTLVSGGGWGTEEADSHTAAESATGTLSLDSDMFLLVSFFRSRAEIVVVVCCFVLLCDEGGGALEVGRVGKCIIGCERVDG
jgi:hypothetical protein